jgi:high affinity sulfate transporter 1
MRSEELQPARTTWWPQPFAGLRALRWADVPREISAGITLAALIIPLNIGYAQVAGLPPVVGLYAAVIPLVIFALFTASRHVVGSPDAAIAALVGATLLAFAAPGDPLLVQYATALAVMCGLLFFVFWYFRLAFLANFLSRAVLVGFISGLGIEVLTSQVRKILGASGEGGSQVTAFAEQVQEGMAVATEGYVVELLALVESVPRANLYSIAIGLGAIVIARLLKRYAPKAPGALISLILATVTVAMLNLNAKGVSVLGAIPSGLPSISWPAVPPADYLRLLPGAMAVVAITLCEGLLLVRQYSRKHGYKADGDQVLFAYGIANLAAGVSGALVTGNSASRSAAMESCGARSQLPSIVAAGTIALVMLFFTDLLAFLPNAALAGIVANSVISLIEVKELRELYKLRRSEFWIALACLVSVLVLGPLRAVLIAFLLTTIDVVRRASTPGTWTLREAPDGSHFVPTAVAESGDGEMIVYRFGSPLYFANANLFAEEVEKLVTHSPTPVKCFVLDAEAISDVDTTGAEVLHQFLTLLANRGVVFAVARANAQLLPLLRRYKLLEAIGENRLYPTNRHAVASLRQEIGKTKCNATALVD